jgi:hypothetical protein
MHLATLALIAFILLPLPAVPQEPPQAQPATTGTPFTITFESIRPTQTGLIVTVSYVNTLAEPLQLTLTYPQEKSGFAADNLGNEYTLANATAMERRHHDANLDITNPIQTNNHSTFLLAPPQHKALASYQFRRTSEQPAATISLGLYARPAKDFLPPSQPQRGFTFTATTTDAKPQ